MHNTTGNPLEEHRGVSQPNATMSFGTIFFHFGYLILATYIHTYVPNRYRQETFYLTPVAKKLATRWADKEIIHII